MSVVRVNNRVIGILDPIYRTFDKNVRKSVHLFRVYDAWGIDAKYFRDILFEGGYTIRVFEREEGILYKVTAEKWKKHAEHQHHKKGKIDHKAQTFLSRRFFEKYNYK